LGTYSIEIVLKALVFRYRRWLV